MNTIVTIIELVELAALITLVIYLIRLTRDNNELRDKLNKSELVDRNLDELNEFNGAMVSDPDIARIWQDGCDGYRLNDIDCSRFSLLASQYLSMMSNQKQRADSIEDWAQAEAATGRLIEALMSSPGLIAAWDTLAGKIASPELRAAVNQALTPPEPEESAAEEETTEAQAPAAVAEESAPAVAEESPSVEVVEPGPAVAESQDEVTTETVAKTGDLTETPATANNREQATDEAEPTSDRETQEDIRIAAATAAEKDTASKQADTSVAMVDDNADPAIVKAT
ncbi:MAG: hypothetical protein KJN90_01245 [Gammaproteobacteria bacterium]|nr:hypothetical protein [Gammaproteobacteria bacterium]